MDTKGLLRVVGVIGFIMAAVSMYVYMAYILVPVITPLLTHEIEAQLSSEGVPISQGLISTTVSLMTTVMIVAAVVGLFIGWLIESAVLWALMRAFGVGAGFMDTWLLSGNYLYLNVVQIVTVVTTPLFNYVINAIITHRGVLGDPAYAAVSLLFTVMGSLLLAYIFSRVYGISMGRALIPALIALVIFWAASLAI